MRNRLNIIAMAGLFAAGTAQAVSLTGAGYTQNFDSMGAAGTAPPTDWVVYTGNSGTSNTTWGTATSGAITANGANSVATMIAAATPLTAITSPTATNNNGYNAALDASSLTDRVLATSPTTVSGAGLQLTLTNNTGAALSGLTLSFDTVRFTAATSVNEIPGYWLFYSLDGSTWANVSSLNPTIATVPTPVGVTATSGSFYFSASVAPGAAFSLRWVDDNAAQTSPDQIIGLNNVTVSAVPEPGAVTMMLAGLAVMLSVATRRRSNI